MKNSAPGLDQILVTELKFAASWPPTLLTDLAELFNCIENSQRWPQVLTKGVVPFIPKDVNNPQPKPDEFRPITILNTRISTLGRCKTFPSLLTHGFHYGSIWWEIFKIR